MLPIRAWLKVSCSKTVGSRAGGRDSALPHLPGKAGKSPSGWKNPHSKCYAAKPLYPNPHLLCLVKLPISAPSLRGSGWSKEAPKAVLHHHPQVTHHPTSPSTSQPGAAAIGMPNISPEPSGFIDTSSSAIYASLACRSALPCSGAAGPRTCPLGTHIPRATRVHRQLPAHSEPACLRITPKIPEERKQCLPTVTNIKTNSKTGSTHLSAGER